jgi:hypothetical protein
MLAAELDQFFAYLNTTSIYRIYVVSASRIVIRGRLEVMCKKATLLYYMALSGVTENNHETSIGIISLQSKKRFRDFTNAMQG